MTTLYRDNTGAPLTPILKPAYFFALLISLYSPGTPAATIKKATTAPVVACEQGA